MLGAQGPPTGRIYLQTDEPELQELSQGVNQLIARAAQLAPAGRYAEAGIEWLPGRSATAIDRAARSVQLDDGRRVPYHGATLEEFDLDAALALRDYAVDRGLARVSCRTG